MMGENQPSDFVESFKQREIDILRLIKQGLSNQEIAHKLHLSLHTVKKYNQIIFNKLGVTNRTQAIEKAQAYGLIEQQAALSPQPLVSLVNNLPAMPNSFIGRTSELAALRELMQTCDIRLVTIVGPAGVGKTRLGLELAHQLLPYFHDKVFFVSLAPLNDPFFFASAVAQVLGIRETGGVPLQKTLVDSLRKQELLLLLDNFEHILSAAPFVSELLAAAPGLKILATSRAPLHVYGEQIFPLEPFTTPETPNPPFPENLLQFDSIRLFVERARATRLGFTLSPEQAAPVAKICQRLDGLPLAIELSAARVRTLSPAAMAAQFDGSEGRFPFPMLANGPRDAPARHHTLHNAIAWSFALLPAEEQVLFRRLGVFAGGWTRQAAEAICQKPGELLDALMDMSLLVQSDVGSEPRFGMLEMVRAYAQEQLGQSGETEMYQQLHAEYFLKLVEMVLKNLRSPSGMQGIYRLVRERDNLRAVMSWGLRASQDCPLERRIRMVLTGLDDFNLPAIEIVQWIKKALARLAEEPAGADNRERQLLEADLLGLAGARSNIRGDHLYAQEIYKQYIPLSRKLGDLVRVAHANVIYVQTLIALGSFAEAKKIAEETEFLGREFENPYVLGHALSELGWLAGHDRDYGQAETYFRESQLVFKEVEDPFWEAMNLSNIGRFAQDLGDHERAQELYLESLSRCWKLNDLWGVGLSLEKAAWSAAAFGDYNHAVRLFAATDKLHQAIDMMINAQDQPTHDQYLSLARAGLTVSEFDTAWSEGQAWTWEQAVTEALQKRHRPG